MSVKAVWQIQIQITYPGVNNFSAFAYDGLGRNVSIVETTAGSVTSTKQFVWAGGNKARESRDGLGALLTQFFKRGQIISATKYFYEKDHLGSVREMTNSAGSSVSDRSYDPFGRVSVNSETVSPDFGYGSYYVHPRSGLNLTRNRAYNSVFGRFINRDRMRERGGHNLFSYVSNKPVSRTDPSGNAMIGMPSLPNILCVFFPSLCQPHEPPPEPPNDPPSNPPNEPPSDPNHSGHCGPYRADPPEAGNPPTGGDFGDGSVFGPPSPPPPGEPGGSGPGAPNGPPTPPGEGEPGGPPPTDWGGDRGGWHGFPGGDPDGYDSPWPEWPNGPPGGMPD